MTYTFWFYKCRKFAKNLIHHWHFIYNPLSSFVVSCIQKCKCLALPCFSPFTGKTGRDHGTRFGGKRCPLLRCTRVSAGVRCIFITDSVQTVVRHLESVRSPRFSRHCTVRTPCITVRTPFIRLQTPYGLRVFYVRAPCVCLRRPNGLSYLWFRRCPLLPVFSRLLLAPSLPNNG